MKLPKAAAWEKSMTPTSEEDSGQSVWDYRSYLGIEVGIDRAYAVAWLLVPEFVEVRGCVLRRDRYELENFEHWWTSLNGDVARIEAVINHLSIWDVFPGSADDAATDRAFIEFARAMAVTWEAALSNAYPNRRFCVDITDDYGPTVSFHSLA